EAGKAHRGQGRVDGFTAGGAEGFQPGQVFPGAEGPLDAGLMAEVEHVVAELPKALAEGNAAPQDLPFRGGQGTGQQAQQSGLAGAIGAADLEHVAPAQAEGEAGKHRHIRSVVRAFAALQPRCCAQTTSVTAPRALSNAAADTWLPLHRTASPAWSGPQA